MSMLVTFIASSLVVVGVLLLLLVLCQRGRGAGLPGATSGHTVLGVKTAEALTWVTASAFAVFVLLAVVLNLLLG